MSALNRLDLMIGDQKSELSQFSESLSPSPNNCRKYQKDYNPSKGECNNLAKDIGFLIDRIDVPKQKPKENIIKPMKKINYDLLEKLLQTGNTGSARQDTELRSKSFMESTRRPQQYSMHQSKREFIEAEKAGRNLNELKEIRNKPTINKASRDMASMKNAGIPIYERYEQELQVKENKIQE